MPVKVIRDKKPMTFNVKVEELDLEAEQARSHRRWRRRRARRREPPKDTGFMTIGRSRGNGAWLRLPQGRGGVVVSEVDPTLLRRRRASVPAT